MRSREGTKCITLGGSRASVVAVFWEQIQRGGPVTVTHPDIRRYFITPSEAAILVLQAGAIGEGGEVFILDMGAPVAVVDLAREMLKLAGLITYSSYIIVKSLK